MADPQIVMTAITMEDTKAIVAWFDANPKRDKCNIKMQGGVFICDRSSVAYMRRSLQAYNAESN